MQISIECEATAHNSLSYSNRILIHFINACIINQDLLTEASDSRPHLTPPTDKPTTRLYLRWNHAFRLSVWNHVIFAIRFVESLLMTFLIVTNGCQAIIKTCSRRFYCVVAVPVTYRTV